MKPTPSPFETPSQAVWNTKTETETRDEDLDERGNQTKTKKRQRPQTARFVESRQDGIVARALERKGKRTSSPNVQRRRDAEGSALIYVALFASIALVIIAIGGGLPH